MMTAGQIRKAVKIALTNRKYLLLRWSDNVTAGVNPKAIVLGMKERQDSEVSKIVSYQLISFSEYIRTKIRFV